MPQRVLVTGGAGFVGSSLAIRLKQQHPDWELIAFDNLHRRGSELCLPRLRAHDIRYRHGDTRVRSDLDEVGAVDLILECSAEPSVLAGIGTGSASYALETNLVGTINALEHARRHGSAMIFLSSSRIYPIAPLLAIPYVETDTRLEIDARGTLPAGLSPHGIGEDFPLAGPRSIYGATKLCSELLITEYVDAFGLRIVTNRCSVLTGPWQMGRVDQGVVMHWVLSHVLKRPLSYIGYGGSGKQVRDILHIDDLGALVDAQLGRLDDISGSVFNVGGGRECSVSLRELTEHCVQATGKRVPISPVAERRQADIPIFLTDSRRAQSRFAWRPARTAAEIVEDVTRWVTEHKDQLARALD